MGVRISEVQETELSEAFVYRSRTPTSVEEVNQFHVKARAAASGVERMPETFRAVNGEIRKTFRHKLVSERPEYVEIARA